MARTQSDIWKESCRKAEAERDKAQAEAERLGGLNNTFVKMLSDANREVDHLREVLVAECRGGRCDSEGCGDTYIPGYRNCSGCERRAKDAIHINPGDGSCMRHECKEHAPNAGSVHQSTIERTNTDE